MSVKGGMKFGVGDNSGSGESIFRLPPFYYMHVLDLNKNVTRVELGPQTYIRQDNERVVQGPDRMITVAPRHYCIIENHVLRDEAGNALTDTSGQVRLAHADLEIRLAQDPFPLYPGEKLKTPPTALRIVPADSALRLKATLDFEEENGEKRVAGDEWLFEGPGTYIPRKEVSVEETVRATTILPNQALRLRARRETLDRQGNSRVTGEEWLIAKVSVKKTVRATTILPSQALRLRARRNTLDRQGNSRVTGEEWLIAEVGAYLPGAYEEVVHVVSAHVLTDKTALHVRALRTHKDQFGKTRKNGEEWLVRMSDAETYIPDVYEEVVDEAGITILTNREYCFVLNPIGADDKPQFGKRKLVKGERSFFLQPGEALEAGIQDIYVLDETEGLILRANEGFTDGDTERSPGDRWMIRGPLEYVPPVEVEVVDRRAAIPLDENEGIYVRDIKTGKVRAVIGETYLLTQDEMLWSKSLPGAVESLLSPSASTLPFLVPGKGASLDRPGVGASFNAVQAYITAPPPRLARPSMRGVPTQGGLASFGMTNCIRQDESLWEKELPAAVEGLLGSGKDPLADRGHRHAPESAGSTPGARDRTRVVTFRVPHNAAVQIYDYKEKHARVTFGPELVMLSPDEHFTQLSLSGGKPKRPNVIKSLCLLLGPDFCTDIVTVETSDHARLSLQLSYNWHFDSGEKSQTVAAKLFSVPDFVGDACKAIASRVRGMVAQVAFDDFHKNSARIIRSAVFGMDSDNKVRDRFVFSQNQLVVTSIDIQSVEPVDQKTRDSLMKSVQLAIEITTNSQEATARHEAERIEQEAKGRLERQKISDEAEAEKSRKELLELQALSAAVESTGQAKAEAQSQAESARIEGEAAVEMSRLKAEASKIDTESELNRLKAAREAELVYLKEKNSLEVSRAREMAEIDTNKFGQAVNVLGTSTIQAIACAGPEMQVKLLQGLGLQTALITDGSSPINLFNTAQGLVGGGNMGALMGQPKPKE